MKLTHLNEDGTAYMVDATAKDPTVRQASAVYCMGRSPEIMQALRDGTVPKGDVLAVARAANVPMVRRVPELLPLAHTTGVHGCAMGLSPKDDRMAIRATIRTVDRMGAEVEALTSVTMAALTTMDMVRGVDRSARIHEAKVVTRSGSRSGDRMRPEDSQT